MYKFLTAFMCRALSCILIKSISKINLTVIIWMVALIQVSASGRAQSVNINAKNSRIEKILDELGKQSGYHFLYNVQIISKASLVTIKATNSSLEQVLVQCFANQPFTYVIAGKNVIIRSKTIDSRSVERTSKPQDKAIQSIKINDTTARRTGSLMVGKMSDSPTSTDLVQSSTAPKINGRGKTVILTFDDAPESQFRTVAPLLHQYGFGATFYVCEFPPNYSDSTLYMNWRQIKILSQMGFEIGNHTWHHQSVASLTTDADREREICYVEQQCQRLGIPQPTSFCYPNYVTDTLFIATLRRHNYLTAKGGEDRPWYPKTDQPYFLPSFTLSGNQPNHFYHALEQARTDNVIVFCLHGVPDIDHPWVSTPPELLAYYLKYLHDHHFRVLSMQAYLKKIR